MRLAYPLAGFLVAMMWIPAAAQSDGEDWCAGLIEYLDAETRLSVEGEIADILNDGCVGYLDDSGLPPVELALGASGSERAANGSDAGDGVTQFVGNGYSMLVPDLGWQYSRDTGGDTWVGEVDEGVHALSVSSPVSNFLSIEQSPEGARDRFRQSFADMGVTVVSEELVQLPSGPAYKTLATGDVGSIIQYSFYRLGVGMSVTTINLKEAVVDAIAESFRWG